jgi:hypothetical protein
MKNLLLMLVIVAGGGLAVLALKFGTVAPCGILRAEVRQEAARQGGFALVVSALPDAAIDALLAAQFGPLSPRRCLQLAIAGPPIRPQTSPALSPRPNPEQADEQQARIRAMQLANLRNLTEQLSAFTAKADVALPKFAPVEQRYHDITQRMRGALAREQSIYGGGQASVVRGQISVAINQAAIEANQLHIGIGSSYQSFDFQVGQLERESAGASQGCRGAHAATDSAPVRAGYEAQNAACLRFFDVAKEYEQRVSDLRAAFSKAEAIWNAERHEQEQIVQASNMAVR